MFHIDVLGKPEKRKNETRKKGEKKERKKEKMHFSTSLVISNRSAPGTTHN